MALGKRSLMNEHMVTVLRKVSESGSEPVQKSYLYYSQAEKEAVDYMIAVDLLKEASFVAPDGKERKGYVLGDFGKMVAKEILTLQMRMNIQEDASSDPEKKEAVKELQMMRTEYNSAVECGSDDRVSVAKRNVDEAEERLFREYNYSASQQVRDLDDRGSRKMETISKWKQQRKVR